MSSYELNRAMHGIYIDRDIAKKFAAGDNAVLDRFDLSPEERETLAARDLPKLWAMDAHPIILFHLSAILHPREFYITEVIPHIRGVPNHWYDYYRTDEAVIPE